MNHSIILLCCLTAGATAFAQHEKKAPPPPASQKVEIVKDNPPVIIGDVNLVDFYKRNPGVAELRWESEKVIEVRLKDKNKKAEVYDLPDETEGNTFKAKYGDPSAPLAPPHLPERRKEK